MKYVPYKYQEFAGEHIFDHPYAGLFLDMGLGKTVVTLTYLNRLIYQECEVEKALIIAPKHVTRSVWKQEAAKWDHLKHLKVSIVWGKNEKERIAALRTKADIYVINRENVVWLVNLFQSKFPFRTVVIDELSSFKSHKSQRFKALKLVRPQIRRLVGLTGTPAPNSLIDLWAPLYLLDEGVRLEKTISGYRERYFSLKNPGDIYSGYKIRKCAEENIYEKIGDICISMKAKDYLDLPPLIENDIYLDLEDKMMDRYKQFEEECVMEILSKKGELEQIVAMTAAALSTKLLQYGNGAIYHEDKTYSILHDTKLDALSEIMEDSFGQPVLVFYSYKHDLERIKARFPKARMLKTPKDIDDWNEGKIELLLAHPASAGHGLNLQAGGNIMVWFGLTWSLELYQQAIARLFRQGQTKSIIMHRLIMRNTMDIEVVKSLARKEAGQDALMNAVRALVNKYNHQVA